MRESSWGKCNVNVHCFNYKKTELQIKNRECIKEVEEQFWRLLTPASSSVSHMLNFPSIIYSTANLLLTVLPGKKNSEMSSLILHLVDLNVSLWKSDNIRVLSSLLQRENGDLRKMEVGLNLLKVGHTALCYNLSGVKGLQSRHLRYRAESWRNFKQQLEVLLKVLVSLVKL